ncbi:hypothetical protein U3516DRAFT_470627, partial [Neocallimastix sp. 'constans']
SKVRDLENFDQVSVFCSDIGNMPPDKTAEAELTIKETINAISKKAKGCTDNSITGLYIALIEKIKNKLSISFPFVTPYANNAMNTIAGIDLINHPDKLGTLLFSSQQIEGYFDLDILLESAGLLYRYNYEYLKS